MFPSIIRLDILFETISFTISLVISVVALAGGRKTGSRSLTLLSFGFFLMAAAMLLRVVLTTWALSMPFPRPPALRFLPILILQTQELVYSVIRISAYAVFLYLYSAYSATKAQTSPGLIAVAPSLIYNPLFEAVSAVIIFIVVLQLIKARNAGESPYVLYGFILLMLSHVLFLALPLWLIFYFVAQFLQFVALSLFLAAVLTVFFHGQRLQV